MNRSTASQRMAMLKKLLKNVLANREKMQAALHADYNRHPVETDLADTWVVVKELKFAIKNLEQWMQPKTVPTSLVFFGSTSEVYYEAKGVVLIVSTWNLPFNLALSPLVSAIAAGNTVMIKPSEFTSHSSHVLREIIEATFLPEQVMLIEGGKELSEALLKLPFNHIFFTGSENVGKIVMKAAAENLASVTLELGGKSPVIVDDTVNLEKVAEKVAYARFINNGQVCIAADYVYVHKSVEADFISELKKAIVKMYPEKVISENPDYARIVNKHHLKRIENLVDEAVSKGAVLHTKAEFNAENRFVAPIILGRVSHDMLIDHQEIFGPVFDSF